VPIPAPTRLNEILLTLRGDLKWSNEDSFFMRYSLQKNTAVEKGALFASSNSDPSNFQDPENTLHSVVAGWTKLFSNGKVNQLRGGCSLFQFYRACGQRN